MDYPNQPTTPVRSRIFHRLRPIATPLLIVLIVLVGAYFRTVNLRDWDGGTDGHPDERYMRYTVAGLRVPQDWRTYFVSTCPSPMPNPSNEVNEPDPEKWEPSLQSGCSTLNPRNYNWSRGYVYGTLPTTLTRVVAEATGQDDLAPLLMVGRGLSVAADLITLITLFALARTLYGRRVGLLAAALYAGAVMPIQQSHYFTVDNFAVCFGTLALFFVTRLARHARWRDAILTAICIGAAVASKINMAALVALVFVALAQWAWRNFHAADVPALSAAPNKAIVGRLLRIVLLLAVTGVVTLAAFRVFQPDAFAGPHIWNLLPEPRFVDRLREARITANGSLDIPSSHQWADRTPWLFPLQNMVQWGMGVPLGVAAWIGWAIAGWQLVVRRRGTHLIPWVWITLYFAWQGGIFNPTMRYFLPIYPPLIMFGAWALIAALDAAKQHLSSPKRRSVFDRLRRPALISAASLAIVAVTWLWAWGYTRIYTRPYTRVAAAEWLQRVAPNGSTSTNEYWDDALRLPYTDNFAQITTFLYGEEELPKYIGRLDTSSSSGGFEPGLIDQLAQADYVVLTSPRVYGSIERIPQRFPAALRYYAALFDGSLGFELVGDFHSFPSFLGLPISDIAAEEAYYVYDHPRVLIFQRTDDFSPDRVRQILTSNIAWDEVYRGLRPSQVNQAPTALQLTAPAWDKLQQLDMRYLFSTRLGPIGSVALWLGALEVLGLAAIGWLWWLKLPLVDRGLSLARPAGLLAFAIVPALLGTTQLLTVSRTILALWFGALVLPGLWRVWRDRAEIGPFVQRQRWVALMPQGLYAGVLAVGLIVARSGSITSGALARWTALIRSATLPPFDPFFAGGLDPMPYAARVPWALLDRLLGVLPSIGLSIALATALALTVQALWSAIVYGTTPRGVIDRRVSARYMATVLVAAVSALLILAPGLALGDVPQMGVWYALRSGDLSTLGSMALASSALAFAASLRHALGDRRTTWGISALTLAALTLVAGQSRWAMLALWIGLVTLVLSRVRGYSARSIGLVAALGGALLLSRGFTWSIAPPALAAAPFAITSGALVLGLALPALVIVALAVSVGPLLTDRLVLRVVAGICVVWTLVAGVLGWSIALLGVPLLMAATWLAVQAWVPGVGVRRWRSGAVFATCAAVVLLLIVAGLVGAGRLPGDAQHLLAVATLLLVVVAGWSLPLVLWLGRRALRARSRTARWGRVIVGLGVIALIGVGSVRGIVQAAAQNGEQISQSSTIEAERWLATQTAGSPVVVRAPQPTAALATNAAGLPLLLSAIDDVRQQRDILMPTVGSVIDGRRRAIEEIYGGDVQRSLAAIQNYHVGYVVLGPDEQAAFGSGAGASLDLLAQQGVLNLAYDQNGARIYQTSPQGTPQFVASNNRLSVPSTKTLRLDQPVDGLPIVNEYGWNTLVAQSQPLGVGLWLLLLEVLGLLAFPLTALVFRRWHDHGWGLSKLVGLLVWGYAVWLPVNLGWWLFSWRALVIGALVLAGGSLVALRQRRRDPNARLLPAAGTLIRSEVCFLIAFGLWTLVRAANPDLWHPFQGGEKPFEFGFLNAILRSPVLPPYDPFFSDGIINYYYYGLFLVSLPIKAIGVAPAIGFNLAIATLVAFMASAGLALGREITGRWRYGVCAVFLLLATGPLASVIKVVESQGLSPVVAALQGGMAGFGGRLGIWFWGPSRIMPHVINEFPLFSFLFADLHPHLIALPITLLAIACAVELVQRRHSMYAVLPLSALVIGALAIANSWDAPTYALLIGGAIVGRAWRGRGHVPIGRVLLNMGGATLIALGTVIAGVALYTPFFLHYQAQVGGIGRVQGGDTVREYVLFYGPLLLISVTLLGSLSWVVARRAAGPWRTLVRASAIGLPLLIGALLLSGSALAQDTTTGAGWSLKLVLGLLAITAITLAFVARLRDKQWLSLWLIAVGLLVGLGIQFIFIRDHLADSPAERMNTVFKFGLQIWVLWSIGAATALPLVLRVLRRNEVLLGMWNALLIMLILPGIVYPLAGIPSRLSTRFDQTLPLTLDGLAFLETASYNVGEGDTNQTIALRDDAQAITWINTNIVGTPVFATSDAEFYRTYGMRIAANTGVPTVLGRLHQDEQRPSRQVAERHEDVENLFVSPDPQVALQLLAKYHVDYVYVGPIERALYTEAGAAKWQQMVGTSLEVAYQNAGVTIYHVRPETLASVQAIQPQPVVLPPDPALRAAEEQLASDPGDSSAAFGLAQRYIDTSRLEDAARVLDTAAQANPNDVPLHHLLGDVQIQLGNGDAALAAWQQAANVQPSAPNLNKLGQGLVQLGRWDAAERVLQQVLAIDPAFVEAHFYLGELYRERDASGDRERAIAAYQQYLAGASADAAWRGLAETHLQELEP